jgi:hypothetical protein
MDVDNTKRTYLKTHRRQSYKGEPHCSYFNKQVDSAERIRMRVSVWKWEQLKAKAVPQHAMGAIVGKGDIAPSHSWPRH